MVKENILNTLYYYTKEIKSNIIHEYTAKDCSYWIELSFPLYISLQEMTKNDIVDSCILDLLIDDHNIVGEWYFRFEIFNEKFYLVIDMEYSQSFLQDKR